MNEKRKKIRSYLVDLLSKSYFRNLCDTESKVDLILKVLDEEGVDLSDPERMPLPESPEISEENKSVVGSIPHEEAMGILKDAHKAVNHGFREHLIPEPPKVADESKAYIGDITTHLIMKRIEALETKLNSMASSHWVRNELSSLKREVNERDYKVLLEGLIEHLREKE
jgi:hypothetical protein